MAPSDLMLYVHIPFCVHKCHYCDFNSHERLQPDWAGYQQALIHELEQWCRHSRFAGRKLASIFFGGGTPSLAPPGLIGSVIDCAEKLLGFKEDIEITMEANPGTVDRANFTGFHNAGINRLSMGVQSLDSHELKWLERIHSADDVFKAFQAARDSGFNNINLDLIYGLPNQSIEAWLQSLNKAVALKPEHLSCYQLTVEPHTRLAVNEAAHPSALPDDELAVQMLLNTRAFLADAGYQAYEISNFAKPERHCRHNDGYWRYFDYIGIGAGAAGKFDLTDGGIERYSNLRSPEGYAKAVLEHGNGINSSEQLTRAEATGEAAWLALRRSDGLSKQAFYQRFGIDPGIHFAETLKPWINEGLIHEDTQNISLTSSGLPLADSIASSLLA